MQPIRNLKLFAGLAVLSLALVTAGPAAAQFATGFEAIDGYVGAPDGSVPVSGQGGWYNPDPTTSDDQSVYTYDGNAFNFPVDPNNGGDQFLAAMHLGDGNFPRAQHGVNMTGGGTWTITYDTILTHVGRHVKNNGGSFSLSDPGAGNTYFISIDVWQKNLPGRLAWRKVVSVYDSTGVGPTLLLLPKQFRRLFVNQWYTESITIDLDQNQITSLSLTDLSGEVTVTINPTLWYMYGGLGYGSPPTAFRFFVGGGTGADPGNVVGRDNITIVPGPAPALGRKVINLGDAECIVLEKSLGVTH